MAAAMHMVASAHGGKAHMSAPHRARHSSLGVTCALPALPSFLPGGGGRQGAARRTRDALLQELRSAAPDRRQLDALLGQLADSQLPFRESQLGGGAWQVVHTRGAALWKAWTAPGDLLRPGNRASQAFDPATRTVENRGEVLGEGVFVTASGAYRPADDSTALPKLLLVSVEGGALHVGGTRLPLPIRGSGKVFLAYLDPDCRVFSTKLNGSGTLTLQVRQDRLAQLLGAAAP